MSLKITAGFTEKQIRDYCNQQLEAYKQYVISVYSKAGQAMVEDARSRSMESGDSFGNITWNLRSSIGCVVMVGGQTVFSYFPVLMTGAEGSRTGEDYAKFIGGQVTENDEIVLVVVAGMEYARSVEDRNKNVITATSLIAEQILEQYIQQAA